MYDIKEMRPEAVQVAHLILAVSEELQRPLIVSDYHKDDYSSQYLQMKGDQSDVVYRNASELISLEMLMIH